jgi:putative glutamine amidotransferase
MSMRTLTVGERRAVVGVSCCTYSLDGPHHVVFDQYLGPLLRWANCIPVLLPALGEERGMPGFELAASWLDVLDGVLLTGSCSNVHPSWFGQLPSSGGCSGSEIVGYHDVARDFSTLHVVRGAIEREVPLLGICRGLQEINVALGGSLRQSLAPNDEHQHRAPRTATQAEKYRPSHSVQLTAGGILSKAFAAEGERSPQVQVNSLHRQGVDRLAPSLICEAVADDGLIEGLSLGPSSAFCLGVQWHPEWFTDETPHYRALFKSFGRACARRLAGRRAGSPLRAGQAREA